MELDHLLNEEFDNDDILNFRTNETDSTLEHGDTASYAAFRLNKNNLKKPWWIIASLLRSTVRYQSRALRIFKWVMRAGFLFLAISLVNAILRPSYTDPPPHYVSLSQRILASTHHGRGNLQNEKIYIAANIINEDLIRGSWGTSLHELVNLLGSENVFLSIYENDSGPGTRAALRALQQRLKCNSSFVTGGHLSMSDFPKVHLSNGDERVQRITYLSEVRNQLLRPLDSRNTSANLSNGFRSASDVDFNRILFLNDIYFNPVDALQLLFSTNQGHYRAACAMDFKNGPLYYDTFATRDYEGYGMGLMLYPWFAPIGGSVSRNDIRSQTDAVRVRSCWGGMAVFEASQFRSSHDQLIRHCQSTDGKSCTSLRFRSSNEAFWESSECCLIFADLETLHGGGTEDVFMNPYVRVAYHRRDFDLIPFFRRFERFFEYIQLFSSKAFYPDHNPRRTHEPGDMVQELIWQAPTTTFEADQHQTSGATTHGQLHPKGLYPRSRQVVAKSGGHWTTVERQAIPGGFCGQRTMFVMKPNLAEVNEHLKESARNWDKISVPKGLIGKMNKTAMKKKPHGSKESRASLEIRFSK